VATLEESIQVSSHPLLWLRKFLREELAPYDGRAFLVARLATAATLVMIISMTFRTPYGAYAALFALTLSRESLGATAAAVRTLAIGFVFAGAYILFGALLAVGEPMWRLLWVIATLFTIFYAMRVLTNYAAAGRFGYIAVITLPLWDSHVQTELKVENTLWAVFIVTVSSIITFLVELVFKDLRPGDDLIDSIAERLASIEKLLTSYADGHAPDEAAKATITRLAVTGTSRLRRMLHGTGYARHYGEQMGAIVALVGRAVDLAANLATLSIEIEERDRKRIRNVAERIATIRADLARGTVPRPTESSGEGDTGAGVPLLSEIEKTVSLIPAVCTGSQSLGTYAYSPSGNSRLPTLFVPDALSNTEHVRFALRGCLAASLCYIIYNALAWPELSTAVTTCLLTALTTIGASRQKQILRLAGALVGGVLVGIGAQVYILPHLDSIAEFTVLFLAVTIPAAWIITSSPRLSYCGVQIAIAFYLINLQEFKMQTSLEVARDRVIGIVLGLSMMWLAFDRLWGVPAVAGMKKTFISAVRSLAQFLREPSPGELQPMERSYSLRETISSQLDQVRSQADAVLFEFGSSRQQALALRLRIVSCSPQLRTLFVIRTALLKYRLRLPGFELPDIVGMAQQQLDEQMARTMDSIADRMEGKVPKLQVNLEESRNRLEQAISACSPGEREPPHAERLQTLASLSRTAVGLISSFDRECDIERNEIT